MQLILFNEGEKIIEKGAHVDSMYFIKKGSVSLVIPEFDNFKFYSIPEGYHFGETDILFESGGC